MYEVNQKRLVKTFIDLVKIPSPSWKEHDMVSYIIKKVKKLNVNYKKYPCGDSYNLYLSLDGSKDTPPLLLSAHMDTVGTLDRVVPIITEKKISSDGTTILGSDDKAAIAIFMEALHIIKERKIEHGPIEIILSCAEEVGLHGIKNFDTGLIRAKEAIVFDSSDRVGKIILKAPYHSIMDIKIKGKSAHAGMEPEKGINAIKVLAEIISKLPSGRIDKNSTMNVGFISGGRATNIVPDEAEAKLEIRSFDKERLNNHEKKVNDTIKKVASRYRAKSKINRELEYTGFSINRKDKIVALTESAMKKINITPEFIISAGGSDANILNRAGIKSLNISCGMRNVHTNKEYILIKDLVNGARLTLSIIDSV
ncbi:M20/M25/M40 family metallo-hydrolase [Spirochaetota bacterium]